MPSDTPIPGSPADWLRYARSDLALTRQQGLPEILLETLCFHTQQAVEKSLKAVFVHQGIVFPYTHDLAQLITRAKVSEISWPEALDAAADLTEYAVGSRYPGVYERVTDEDYREAIEIAQCVFNWANNKYLSKINSTFLSATSAIYSIFLAKRCINDFVRGLIVRPNG